LFFLMGAVEKGLSQRLRPCWTGLFEQPLIHLTAVLLSCD
jgi:hypothetical protein